MSVLASQSPVLPTLASSPALPRHVRDLLKSTLKLASNELERSVSAAIKDFSQHICRQIEGSMDKAVLDHWQRAQDLIDHSTADLILHFMHCLEAELANLHEPQIVRGHLQTRYRSGDELALVGPHAASS